MLPELLRRWAAASSRPTTASPVSGGDGLHGITADLGEASELTTVLTALAALADSPSRFTGVAHIRLHETTGSRRSPKSSTRWAVTCASSLTGWRCTRAG
jgi:hypothetical protein